MPDKTESLKNVPRGTFERCPRCDVRPATSGRNRWCNECNAAYQREYQNGRMGMAKSKGFYKGVEATKECLAKEFEVFGAAGFSGQEIAALIRQAPGPKHNESESDEETTT